MSQKKRSIFEEVGGRARPPPPQGGMIDAGRRGARGAVRIWLMVLFALVVVMIAVGGLTRLTDSGLSITEWRPVTGALPPMSAAAWQAEFEKYGDPGIPVAEQGHDPCGVQGHLLVGMGPPAAGPGDRAGLGRGFLAFLSRKDPAGLDRAAAAARRAGRAQGAIGWWMVSSGLGGEMLDVASYRLAVHLGLAFVILGLIAWYRHAAGRESSRADAGAARREARLFGLSTGLDAPRLSCRSCWARWWPGSTRGAAIPTGR